MNGRKQGRNPRDGLPATHHISAVAHHFLAEAGRTPAGDRPELVVAVLSWRPGPLASYAAAGLAAAAWRDPRQGEPAAASCAVFLEESAGLEWSAASYLGEHHLLPAAPVAGTPVRRYWPWPDDPPVAGGTQEPPLRLVNLGHLDEVCLDHLESLPASLRPAAGALAQARWLVWCLYRQDLTSRRAALALGRLASLARPAGVELLVYPDGWDGRGARETGGGSRPLSGRLDGAGDLPWGFSSLVVPGAEVRVTRLEATSPHGLGGRRSAPSPTGPFLPVLARIRNSCAPIFPWTGNGGCP